MVDGVLYKLEALDSSVRVVCSLFVRATKLPDDLLVVSVPMSTSEQDMVRIRDTVSKGTASQVLVVMDGIKFLRLIEIPEDADRSDQPRMVGRSVRLVGD